MSNNYTSNNGANLYTDATGLILTPHNLTAFLPQPEDVPALALDVLLMAGDALVEGTCHYRQEAYADLPDTDGVLLGVAYNNLRALEIRKERRAKEAEVAAAEKAEWLAFRTSPEALAGLALFNDRWDTEFTEFTEWFDNTDKGTVQKWIDKAKAAEQAERDAVAKEIYGGNNYRVLDNYDRSAIDTIIDLRKQLAATK